MTEGEPPNTDRRPLARLRWILPALGAGLLLLTGVVIGVAADLTARVTEWGSLLTVHGRDVPIPDASF